MWGVKSVAHQQAAALVWDPGTETRSTGQSTIVCGGRALTPLPYRSNRNPGITVGRWSACAMYHPVRYSHCVMRMSFG